MNRLSDEDVDRIARAVVGKLVVWVVVILAAIWVAPVVLIALLNVMNEATRGLPEPVRVVASAAVIAIPIVLVIWAWGRSNRSR
jgi:hypothetical protein